MREVSESPDNIEYFTPDRVREKYPYKGEFRRRHILRATHIKVGFDGEYMWVQIGAVTRDGVWGMVDNIPLRETSPEYGSYVLVKFSEIEDILN